jgi:lipid II:glycine glycyltransferase (peptidoglycan interpeptide bridge formation enzyme)
MGFDGEIEEFIGEFDLVINKSIYHTNRQIKFIKNILEFKKAVK